MNWIGSGFITIIIYGIYETAVQEQFVILTESGSNLLTESGSNLLVENNEV